MEQYSQHRLLRRFSVEFGEVLNLGLFLMSMVNGVCPEEMVNGVCPEGMVELSGLAELPMV